MEQNIDSGAYALAMLLHFHRIPADPEQILHEHGAGGLDRIALLRAAKAYGLKAKAVRIKPGRLPTTVYPLIAEDRQGRFFILGAVQDGVALIQYPGEAPSRIDTKELLRFWDGQAISAATRARLSGEERRFDITWFLPAIHRYRGLFGEVIAASFFLQVFGLVTPLFFQVVVDKVLVHRGLTTLDVLVIGLVAITLFEIVLGGLRSYLFAHTASRIDVELGARLFRHLMALPIAYFESRQVGQTVARVRELENIRNFITGSALTVTIDLFFTIVFFAVMFLYSTTLTLIVLGAIPLYVILSAFVTPVLRRRIEERFQRGAANQSFLVESVSAAETLKSLAVEPRMRERWEQLLAAYASSAFRVVVIGTVGSQGVQLISKLTTALTLWFGAHMVISGELTVGQLIAFNMLAGQTTLPILRLAQLWQDFQQFRISMARLGDVLNAPMEPNPSAGRASLPPVQGAIRFDRVTFRYRPDGPEVLRQVELDAPAGQVLGIVGRSGSGKSTIAKLTQRLYSPESGRVLVDGVDLAMSDPAWLRRQIGVVLQENVLFNRTVRENIALSDPAMEMDEVIAAAKLAGAHEFILELPFGYDTELEERGGNLSGGQRQRIAIARALAVNPRVLIFDEATSALDYESEAAIQENMAEICRGRTVILIAHRLSTLRVADRIVVMDEGRIIEDGNHESLLNAGGLYSRLHGLQAG